MKLSDMQLFRGLEEDDISSLLSCLNSVKRNYKKGEVILSEGSIIENIGIVLSGMAMISCNDIWGNTSILGSVAPGSVFAEVYACIPGQPMLVTVSAVEDTSVLFMNVGRVLKNKTSIGLVWIWNWCAKSFVKVADFYEHRQSVDFVQGLYEKGRRLCR